MHSIDYLLQEVEEKLNMANSMQTHCHQHLLDQNVDDLKNTIDKSVEYHVSALKMRGDWLKSHTENIFASKKESTSIKLAKLEELKRQLKNCLKSIDSYHNEKELRQMLTNTLKSSDIPPAESGLLTFTADNITLSENIASFGTLWYQMPSDGITEDTAFVEDADDGFVFAEMSQEIHKINKSCAPWLIESKEQVIDENEEKDSSVDKIGNEKNAIPHETSIQDDASLLSKWLVVQKEPSINETDDNKTQNADTLKWLVPKVPATSMHEHSTSSSPTSSPTLKNEDYRDFLYQGTKKTNSLCSIDASLQPFIRKPSDGTREMYQYPDRSFLDHCDFLRRQDTSKYLVERQKAKLVKLPFDDEKCQWLYKETCSQEDCKSGECGLFDKNWLRTAADW